MSIDRRELVGRGFQRAPTSGTELPLLVDSRISVYVIAVVVEVVAVRRHAEASAQISVPE